MLLDCEIPKELWVQVGNWTIEPGMENYHLSNANVLGDLENAFAINTII